MKYAPFLFFLVCGEENSVFNKKKNEKVWCVMKKQYLCRVKTERVVLLKDWTMV